jgi:hypothetical protein
MIVFPGILFTGVVFTGVMFIELDIYRTLIPQTNTNYVHYQYSSILDHS